MAYGKLAVGFLWAGVGVAVSIAAGAVRYGHPETPAALVAKVAAKDPAPWVLAGVKKYATTSTFSYSSYYNYHTHGIEPIPWTLFPIDQYGPQKTIFDYKGIRQLPSAPPPGVHPRIWFSPAQLPAIRHRLMDTACGKRAWNIILSWSHALRGTYNWHASYAQPDFFDGQFEMHGNVPLFRLGAFRKPARYWALVKGNTNPKYLPKFMWAVFPLEAFRCLVQRDNVHGRDVAMAISTAVQIALNLKHSGKSFLTWEAPPPHGVPGGFQLALAFDLAYKWFTPQQRKMIQGVLNQYSAYHDNYGSFVAPTNTRSNWTSFSYRALALLSTEGTSGYNPLQLYGIYRAYHNFLTYGLFQHGAYLEGEAKDQLGMDTLIPLAMRCKAYGFKNLIGATHLRAYADEFLPARLMPWGRKFIAFDLLGGVRKTFSMDVIGLHYMFPNDKIVDECYRQQFGKNYYGLTTDPGGYRNDVLFEAVFATDHLPHDGHIAAVKLPLSYLSGQRAFMLTKSGHGPYADMLGFTVRQATGGHPYSDRNSFFFAGAGAEWARSGWEDPATYENSEVTIGNHHQEAWTPGRFLAYINKPMATFGVGSARYCWDWSWRGIPSRYKGKVLTARRVEDGFYQPPKGWQLEMHSMNDFAYTKLPYAYVNTPMAIHPSWIRVNGVVSPFVRRVNYPVKKAFREAGLVRGAYPYALIVDNIQKDSLPHIYYWTMRLSRGVRILKVVSTTVPHPGNAKRGKRLNSFLDIYLMAPDKALKAPLTYTDGHQLFDFPGQRVRVPNGTPELLVRVLEKAGTPPSLSGGQAYVVDTAAGSRLVIPTQAVDPKFKVLLYAFRSGSVPLPVTRWTGGHHRLTIAIGKQVDHVTFGHGPAGNSTIRIVRHSKTLIDVNPTITPMPKRASLIVGQY
jgi:hypothetical protein